MITSSSPSETVEFDRRRSKSPMSRVPAHSLSSVLPKHPAGSEIRNRNCRILHPVCRNRRHQRISSRSKALPRASQRGNKSSWAGCTGRYQASEFEISFGVSGFATGPLPRHPIMFFVCSLFFFEEAPPKAVRGNSTTPKGGGRTAAPTQRRRGTHLHPKEKRRKATPAQMRRAHPSLGGAAFSILLEVCCFPLL